MRRRYDLPAWAAWVIWPFFKFCPYRNAYVLRRIGDNYGPVVVLKDRR